MTIGVELKIADLAKHYARMGKDFNDSIWDYSIMEWRVSFGHFPQFIRLKILMWYMGMNQFSVPRFLEPLSSEGLELDSSVRRVLQSGEDDVGEAIDALVAWAESQIFAGLPN